MPDAKAENGELRCKLGHAVQIEPGLRPQSPKNGSFSIVRRRLSAISLRKCPKSEPGDRWPIRKSPPLAGLSADIRDIFSRRRTVLAGAGGFEPPHGGIKIHCLTTWRRPNRRLRKPAGPACPRVPPAPPVYRGS